MRRNVTMTITYERGKWIELGKQLEVVVAKNNELPKPRKKSLTELFKDFAREHNTTYSSAQFYYYNDIKPKVDRNELVYNPRSYDDELNNYMNNTQVDPIFRNTKNVRNVHKIGTIVQGEIVGLTDFGAFLRTEQGFEGLIHISQITEKDFVTLPEDYFYIGEKVKAKVMRYDGNKLNLSTKATGGKEKINPVFKDLSLKKTEIQETKKVTPKVIQKPKEVVHETKVEPKVIEDNTKVVPISTSNNDKDNIINFIKRYSDNNVSQKALGDLDDLISEYGVFQTTISLMETVRDLDISSFITEMTKERLEGEYLRQ
jgi:predicted RNA-binding protein with RPS1 domain